MDALVCVNEFEFGMNVVLVVFVQLCNVTVMVSVSVEPDPDGSLLNLGSNSKPALSAILRSSSGVVALG